MLTPGQLTTLKNDIAANTNTIGGVQIKNLPVNDDTSFAIANFYNQPASPDYFVWRTSISRSDLYHSTSLDGTTWSWATYKTQAIAEQNAWTQMFMGDAGPIGLTNFRAGIAAIFTGSAPQTAQRDHCFSIGRRKATVLEKLFATVVSNPPANTGNNSGNPRGSATNPDNIGAEGPVSFQEVSQARAT